MRSIALLWGCLAAAGLLRAQEKFPCTIAEYRIESENTIYLRCNENIAPAGSFNATLAEVGASAPASDQVTVSKLSGFGQWLALTTQSGLVTGKSYELKTLPKGEAKYVISTKPSGTIVRPYGFDRKGRDDEWRLQLLVNGNIRLKKDTLGTARLNEHLGPLPRGLDAKFVDAERQSSVTGDPEWMGRAKVLVSGDGPRSLDTQLTVTGIKDVLGGNLTTDPDAHLVLPGAPKDKAESDVYIKFLNQAGPGAKPGWAADIKFAPSLLGLGRGVYLTPEILVDIGLGKVADTKVADTVKAGLGLTKFARHNSLGPWKGTQFTGRAAYETTRTGIGQNIIFDGDAQIFLSGALESIKEQNFRKYAVLADSTQKADVKVPNKDLATRGIRLQLFAGAEVGGRRSEDTIKASEGKSTVVVPTYTVARMRAKFDVAVEYRRLTLTVMVTPRYLFATEIVTTERRITDPEDATKQLVEIFSRPAKGWRPYGEAGLSLALDTSGHFAMTTTYKLGSQPPNFSKIDTVQTGLSVRF